MPESIAKLKGPRILQGKKAREKTMSRIKALKSWRAAELRSRSI